MGEAYLPSPIALLTTLTVFLERAEVPQSVRWVPRRIVILLLGKFAK